MRLPRRWRTPAAALAAVLAAAVWTAVVNGSSAPPPTDAERARAVEIQKRAIRELRAGALAAAAVDGKELARSLVAAAGEVEALVAAAPWLAASDLEALRRTAVHLRAGAELGPSAYRPDEHLAILDRVGQRLLSVGRVELAFEGSFARGKAEEPVYGGHATAMGPPPAAAPPVAAPPAAAAPVADPAADHAIRFEAVRGQLTERTYGGGPSKWHLVESGGNGVALIDYDGDGRLDVYTVSAFDLDERNARERLPRRNALYRNLGDMRFRNVAAEAGVDLAAWGYGVCAGDHDDDGHLDLYVTNYGPNVLYRNRGDGTFEDATARAGLAASGWSTGCAFLDADGDSDLDLYVARYVTAPWEEVAVPERFLMWRGVAKVMLGPAGLPGAADLFFENQGGGRFVERTEAWGLVDTTRAYGFGVVATDYDGDGWTDLFVANDSNPNFLYRNRGGRGFESVGLLAGVAVNAEARAQAGMGGDSGDYDGDGRLDLALTTFAFDHNSLYRNLGGGLFADASAAAGLTAATFEGMSWGLALLDADLDGDVDLFYANGHLFPQVDDHPELKETYAQRDQVFLNDGGRFRDVSPSAGRGLLVRKCSRAVAVGDLDGDGDPDLVVSAMDEEPTLLENTQASGHRWLGVDVRQPGPNAFAIGARVAVECAGRRQVREVRSGGGYLSQSDLRALFGLGACAGPAVVEVALGGQRWRFDGVAVDRHVRLTLGAEQRVRVRP